MDAAAHCVAASVFIWRYMVALSVIVLSLPQRIMSCNVLSLFFPINRVCANGSTKIISMHICSICADSCNTRCCL